MNSIYKPGGKRIETNLNTDAYPLPEKVGFITSKGLVSSINNLSPYIFFLNQMCIYKLQYALTKEAITCAMVFHCFLNQNGKAFVKNNKKS